MVWQTHTAFGFVFTMILLYLIGLPPSWLALGLALLGSLMPDLDASESKIKYLKLKWGQRRTDFFRPFKLLSEIAHPLLGHRGVLHSFLAIFVGLITITLLYFFFGGSLTWYMAFLLGYCSHLLADSLTPTGIPALYPYQHTIRLLPRAYAIRTGSFADYLFLLTSLAILLCALYLSPSLISYLLPFTTS